jgi:hypothetical protein
MHQRKKAPEILISNEMSPLTLEMEETNLEPAITTSPEFEQSSKMTLNKPKDLLGPRMEISEILESCDVHIMNGMLNNPTTNPLCSETP